MFLSAHAVLASLNLAVLKERFFKEDKKIVDSVAGVTEHLDLLVKTHLVANLLLKEALEVGLFIARVTREMIEALGLDLQGTKL